MDAPIVTLDDRLDHRILEEDDVTPCGQPVPMGSPVVQSTTKPCPECFPETAKPKKAKKDADAA